MGENIENYLDGEGNVKEEFRDIRKVFLNNLPHNGKLVSWKDSTGMYVDFIYKGERNRILIKKYRRNQRSEVYLEYKNNNLWLKIDKFKSAKIGKLIGRLSSEHLYKEGDIIKQPKSTIVVTKCFKKVNAKFYKYRCSKDGYIGEIYESDVKRGQGCPICTNRRTMKGINDIATTNPELIKYFYNVEDVYRFSSSSRMYTYIKCPDCGAKRYVRISSLKDQGFTCDICSDGFSYSERLVGYILNVLNIEYKREFSATWSKNRRYDFYFEYNNKKIML